MLTSRTIICQHTKPIRGHKATKVSHKSNYCGIFVDIKPHKLQKLTSFSFVRDYSTQLIALLVHKYFRVIKRPYVLDFYLLTINKILIEIIKTNARTTSDNFFTFI